MIGFFDTMSSIGAVRLDDIVRIDDEKPNAHGVKLRRVHLREGKQFDTFGHENQGLLMRPIQLIPAEPGTSIIRADVDFGEEEDGVYRTRLIAWALCLDGVVRPVTPAGVNDALTGDTYVEMADGSIEGVTEYTEYGWFKNADHMLKDARARKQAKAAAQAKEGGA